MQDNSEMADEHEMAPRPREQMSQDVSVQGHDLFPGHNSGSAYAEQQVQTRRISGIQHDSARLLQPAAGMRVVHEVPVAFRRGLAQQGAEFVVEHAAGAVGIPHVRLVAYQPHGDGMPSTQMDALQSVSTGRPTAVGHAPSDVQDTASGREVMSSLRACVLSMHALHDENGVEVWRLRELSAAAIMEGDISRCVICVTPPTDLYA